jgi:hypothetical protein
LPDSSRPIQIPASHGSLLKVNHLSASAALRGEPRKPPVSQGSCDHPTNARSTCRDPRMGWCPPDSGSPGGARSARVASPLRGRARCGSLRRFRGKTQRNPGVGTRCQRGGRRFAAELCSASANWGVDARLGADWLFNRILGYRTLPKTQLQLPIFYTSTYEPCTMVPRVSAALVSFGVK